MSDTTEPLKKLVHHFITRGLAGILPPRMVLEPAYKLANEEVKSWAYREWALVLKTEEQNFNPVFEELALKGLDVSKLTPGSSLGKVGIASVKN